MSGKNFLKNKQKKAKRKQREKIIQNENQTKLPIEIKFLDASNEQTSQQQNKQELSQYIQKQEDQTIMNNMKDENKSKKQFPWLKHSKTTLFDTDQFSPQQQQTCKENEKSYDIVSTYHENHSLLQTQQLNALSTTLTSNEGNNAMPTEHQAVTELFDKIEKNLEENYQIEHLNAQTLIHQESVSNVPQPKLNATQSNDPSDLPYLRLGHRNNTLNPFKHSLNFGHSNDQNYNKTNKNTIQYEYYTLFIQPLAKIQKQVEESIQHYKAHENVIKNSIIVETKLTQLDNATHFSISDKVAVLIPEVLTEANKLIQSESYILALRLLFRCVHVLHPIYLANQSHQLIESAIDVLNDVFLAICNCLYTVKDYETCLHFSEAVMDLENIRHIEYLYKEDQGTKTMTIQNQNEEKLHLNDVNKANSDLNKANFTINNDDESNQNNVQKLKTNQFQNSEDTAVKLKQNNNKIDSLMYTHLCSKQLGLKLKAQSALTKAHNICITENIVDDKVLQLHIEMLKSNQEEEDCIKLRDDNNGQQIDDDNTFTVKVISAATVCASLGFMAAKYLFRGNITAALGVGMVSGVWGSYLWGKQIP